MKTASVGPVTTIDWSTLRGAFLLNGTVYYGLNCSLNKRTFNKTTGAIGA